MTGACVSTSDFAAERARLQAWAFDGPVPDALCARLLADPAFAPAARTLAERMLALAEGDPRVQGVFKDAGRYVAALLAMHLHLQGGLTLPGLKALCAQSGFISPGRARALLLFLRFLRYVEPAARPGGRQAQRYEPTKSFLAAWRAQSRAALEAAAVVAPAVGDLARELDRPQVFAAFARAHAALLFANSVLIDQEAPFSRTLLHRDAGSHLIWILVAGEGAEVPSRVPAVVPAAAAARRFGVSRIHVRRLLDAAVEAGVLSRDADGAVAFSEASRGPVRLFMAQQLVSILSAAAAALAALDGP